MDAGMGNGLSAFTATYDAAGQLATQTYPNGLTATRTYDNVGTTTSLTYTLPTYDGGTPDVLSFTAMADADGRTVQAQSPLSAQDYAYDNASRLTTVEDSVGGACTTRAYA
jgi:YD repeat-containing protein